MSLETAFVSEDLRTWVYNTHTVSQEHVFRRFVSPTASSVAEHSLHVIYACMYEVCLGADLQRKNFERYVYPFLVSRERGKDHPWHAHHRNGIGCLQLANMSVSIVWRVLARGPYSTRQLMR